MPFREHVVVARKLSPSPFVRALLTPVGYGAISERPCGCFTIFSTAHWERHRNDWATEKLDQRHCIGLPVAPFAPPVIRGRQRTSEVQPLNLLPPLFEPRFRKRAAAGSGFIVIGDYVALSGDASF